MPNPIPAPAPVMSTTWFVKSSMVRSPPSRSPSGDPSRASVMMHRAPVPRLDPAGIAEGSSARSQARGIDESSARSLLGCRRQTRRRDVVFSEDVEDRLAFADQVVGDDAAMTSPPDSLRAHDGALPPSAQLAQPVEAGAEGLTHGVVRVVVKALVRPERVHGRWDLGLPSPETSESGDMRIVDLGGGQRGGKHVTVELRIRARSRNSSNIDHEPDLHASEQIDELAGRSGRMADGEERECRGHDPEARRSITGA